MPETLEEFLAHGELTSERGVHYLSRPDASETDEGPYLEVRAKEGRLYDDEVLRRLPEITADHPLHHEWRVRGESLRRLGRYLRERNRELTLLDVGCGNGWMAHGLASLAECRVFALDVNRRELEQGARVFAENRRLVFLYGDLFEELFPPASFDVITLAGCAQYFPDLGALLERLLPLLHLGGELHLIDSPFYAADEVVAARERTRLYYEGVGAPVMATRYHHHRYDELAPFRPTLLHDPRRLATRIARSLWKRQLSPFPWIRLVREA